MLGDYKQQGILVSWLATIYNGRNKVDKQNEQNYSKWQKTALQTMLLTFYRRKYIVIDNIELRVLPNGDKHISKEVAVDKLTKISIVFSNEIFPKILF